MSDARWFEVEVAITAAVRHFTGATQLFARLPDLHDPLDAYGLEMGFMHAMQSGHTSLEAALLRILDICGEEPPSGARWHADLIARASHALPTRPVVLGDAAARAANETRQFRSIAVHAYDSFDRTRATKAVESATLLATLLPSEVARFRQSVDP